MNRTNHGASDLVRADTDEASDGRLLYSGTLSALGIAIAVAHVPHLIADIREQMGMLALVTGAILPFTLALGLTVAGYRLYRNGLRAGELRRIDLWVLYGILGMTIVSSAFIIYILIEGADLPHLHYVLMDFATVGAVGGLVVGWYDVQNRQHARQLRVFREAVENAGHSVYLTTPSGTIEYVNPAFESQTGFSRDEAIGKTPRILKSGEQSEEYYEKMWETILSGNVWNDEIVNERKDGSHYYVEQTIAPVTDEDGEIEHFVAINNDITELKQYERELRRRNEHLDEFASVVSHDLRNPLNVAMARAEMIDQDRETDHIEDVKKALSRMERLIDDVLTLARQGEMIDEMECVSLRVVSEDAWRQVESPEASLSVETGLAIEADRDRVQQLLENLFRNAVEHGGVDVTVRVEDCDDGFYVEDDGEGFDEETRDQLFESGYTTSQNGTGLGLHIAKQIADAHGWTIVATNGADGGARFEITGVETRCPDTPVSTAD